MKKRTHNILFSLHTVSGIVISAALYVIFFAGSFSFFRDEIVNWEREEHAFSKEEIPLAAEAVADSLNNLYSLYGRDIFIEKYFAERRVNVTLSGSKDSLVTAEEKTGAFFYFDTATFKTQTYEESYTLGEFLYRLHFFAQIYYPVGYYISGFVAFFFMMALITGVLIHWKKIISNFYTFRPRAKLKTLWTDAHTALGIIGLPFQFVLAVTGAFFMLKILTVAPAVQVLYEGNQQELYRDLEFTPPVYEFSNSRLKQDFNLDRYVEETKTLWPDFKVSRLEIHNYGDENMHLAVKGFLDYDTQFTAPGSRTYKVKTGELVSEKNPYRETSYLDGVKNFMYRLHFGDYAGYFLRIISFVLGIISCLVIISGVMIWLLARDRPKMPERKRLFYTRVARIYLAICLSMYPVTALAFIVVKLAQPTGKPFLYSFYFLSWLALSLFYILKKDNFFTNKSSMLLGSCLGLTIPLVHGFVTGNWFWKTFAAGQDQLFFIDIFWLCLALITLFIALRLKRPPSKSVRPKNSNRAKTI